jgi:hypothetical protein
MKPASIRLAILATALICLLGACGGESPSRDRAAPKENPSPATRQTVSISSPAPGTQVKGNVVELQVQAQGIEIKPADGDTSGASGHFHVFVDRDPVAPGEAIPMERGILHSAESLIQVPGLTLGRHKLTVVLGDGAHNRIGEAIADVEVEVQGPTLTIADAPAEVPAGASVLFHAQVEGIQLVPAEQDQGAPGTTGHLHLFINPPRPPTADGQPIPLDRRHSHTADMEFDIRRLPGGREYTFWVVLGDKAHVPYNPLVADRVVVNVR